MSENIQSEKLAQEAAGEIWSIAQERTVTPQRETMTKIIQFAIDRAVAAAQSKIYELQEDVELRNGQIAGWQTIRESLTGQLAAERSKHPLLDEIADLLHCPRDAEALLKGVKSLAASQADTKRLFEGLNLIRSRALRDGFPSFFQLADQAITAMNQKPK